MTNSNKQPVQWWWYTPEEAKQAESWIEPHHLQKWENPAKGTTFYMLSYAGLAEADRRQEEAEIISFELKRTRKS